MRINPPYGARSAAPVTPSLPEGMKIGMTFWATVTSPPREFARGEIGVFVRFVTASTKGRTIGEIMASAQTGVLYGPIANQVERGDQVFVRLENAYKGKIPGREVMEWKFDLRCAGSNQVRFPVMKDGHIIIPTSVSKLRLDVAVPERFGPYIQPAGSELELGAGEPGITLRHKAHLLAGPVGLQEIADQLSKGEPIELMVGGLGQNELSVFSPKFPLASFGTGVRLAAGEAKRRWFTLAQPVTGNMFEALLGGGLIFREVVKISDELKAAFAALEERKQTVSLRLVTSDPRGTFGGSTSWQVALPQFPDRIVGHVGLEAWYLFSAGDEIAASIPSAFSQPGEIVEQLSYGRMGFQYHPPKLEANRTVEAIVGNEQADACGCLVRVDIKGHHYNFIPVFMIPEAKKGDHIQVRPIWENSVGDQRVATEQGFQALAKIQELLRANPSHEFEATVVEFNQTHGFFSSFSTDLHTGMPYWEMERAGVAVMVESEGVKFPFYLRLVNDFSLAEKPAAGTKVKVKYLPGFADQFAQLPIGEFYRHVMKGTILVLA